MILSKQIAVPINYGINVLGAPAALGGLLVAVADPFPGIPRRGAGGARERAAALREPPARLRALEHQPDDPLRSSSSGSSPDRRSCSASTPLTWCMLLLTLGVSMLTFASARTNVLLGAVHLLLFLAYLMLLFATGECMDTWTCHLQRWRRGGPGPGKSFTLRTDPLTPGMTKHVAPRRQPRTGPECGLPHLQTSGQVYLDYTAAALYPETLLREHTEILARQLFGNPHSVHRASQSSTFAAGVAREALFHFLDADPADYDVVWTANASGALRLVGEAFPFGPAAPFILTADNHNSVNGIREQARARGARVTYLPLDDDSPRPPVRASTRGARAVCLSGAVQLLRCPSSARLDRRGAAARLRRPARCVGVRPHESAVPARCPPRLRHALDLQDLGLSHRRRCARLPARCPAGARPSVVRGGHGRVRVRFVRPPPAQDRIGGIRGRHRQLPGVERRGAGVADDRPARHCVRSSRTSRP